MSNTANKVIQIALNEVGYLEKKSNSILDSKTANAGKSNYTKYARDLDNIIGFYNGRKNGYDWCDIFVDWCFVKAFGVEKAKDLLCQPVKSLGAGCNYSMNYYKNKGQFYSKPAIGDQIFFKNGTTITHTGLVYNVDEKYVYTVEGNTSGASGIIANGGGVCKKKYSISNDRIAGYGRPKYDVENKVEVVIPRNYLMKGDNGSEVKTMQSMLIACGYSCGNSGADGSFGEDTLSALKAYQRANGLEVDGYYGSKTKASLTSKYNSLKNSGSSSSASDKKPKLVVDGSFGKLTVLASQKYFGLKQDGKISNQPTSNKKYLEAAVEGVWEFKTSDYSAGSLLIKAMQKKFGVTSDGFFGRNSVKAMQKYLNSKGYNCGIADGYMGRKTVIAYQNWLNKQ